MRLRVMMACLGMQVVVCSIVSSPVQNVAKENDDIAQLVRAAEKLERAYEWSGRVLAVSLVTKHGKRVALKRLALLDHGPKALFDDHIVVDQQVQLALCEIFQEPPTHGRTIYFVRVLSEENQRVRKFWIDRVKSIWQRGSKPWPAGTRALHGYCL